MTYLKSALGKISYHFSERKYYFILGKRVSLHKSFAANFSCFDMIILKREKISANEFLLRKVFLLLGQDNFSYYFLEKLSCFRKSILNLRKRSSELIPVSRKCILN